MRSDSQALMVLNPVHQICQLSVDHLVMTAYSLKALGHVHHGYRDNHIFGISNSNAPIRSVTLRDNDDD